MRTRSAENFGDGRKRFLEGGDGGEWIVRDQMEESLAVGRPHCTEGVVGDLITRNSDNVNTK